MFDADPEPSESLPPPQAGPPPQESLTRVRTPVDYDLPNTSDSPED